MKPSRKAGRSEAEGPGAAAAGRLFRAGRGRRARSAKSLGAVSLGDARLQHRAPRIGADWGSGFRACVAGDTSPAGTILDGYKKVISHTMMGQNCHWEQVK